MKRNVQSIKCFSLVTLLLLAATYCFEHFKVLDFAWLHKSYSTGVLASLSASFLVLIVTEVQAYRHTKMDLRYAMFSNAANLYSLLHFYLRYFENLSQCTTNQLRENAYTLNPEIQNNMMQLLSIRYQPFQKKEPIVVAHLAFLKDFPDVQKAVNHLMDIQKYVLQKQIQRMQLTNEMNPHVKLQDKEVMTYVLELCTELATAVNALETYCGKFEEEDSQYDFSQHKERALSYEQKAIFDNQTF